MVWRRSTLIAVLFNALLVLTLKVRYDGYRLIQITPRTETHLNLLHEWEQNPKFDIWNHIGELGEGVDVLLSPDEFESYKTLLDRNGLEYIILDENIQKRIDEEALAVEVQSRVDAFFNVSNRAVGTYTSYGNVNTYLDSLVQANPSLLSTYVAGRTAQQREIKVLKIKTQSARRNIWINCGIHAREWIAPATCISVIDKLLKEYQSGVADTVDLLNYYEIHILPLLNPDGYEHSRTVDRFWRKNRVRNLGSQCVGVDANRNFEHKWMFAGASSSPCSEIYAGSRGNSELETQAVVNSINAQRGKWDAALDIHSYGHYYLYAYGYSTVAAPDSNEIDRVARISANAIQRVYGSRYRVGSIARTLYAAAGSSVDWFYSVGGIKYSYTLELRPDASLGGGLSGFVLHPSNIQPVGQEVYAGLKSLFSEIKKSGQN